MAMTKNGAAALVLMIALAGSAVAADLPPSMVNIERYAAERGDPDAQYFMAEHYELGDSGMTKDVAKAREWYEKAAQQGHAAAQYKMGAFQEKGLGGLSAQADAAKEWYRRAAAAGNRTAQQRLDELDTAKQDAEAKRQEQVRKAEQEKQELQRKAELEKKRQEQLAAAKAAAVAAAEAPAPAKKEKAPGLSSAQLMEHVIAAQWYQAARSAEFLPGPDMSCLKTGGKEVTCFSKERKRVVGNSEVTFTLKAVLNNFTENAAFDVAYNYNAIDLRDADTAAAADEYGLLAKRGWQQGVAAKCQLKDMGRLECGGAQFKSKEFVAR